MAVIPRPSPARAGAPLAHKRVQPRLARAAHLVVDAQPWIFADTLAWSLLGDQAEQLVDAHRGRDATEAHAAMRVAMATRSSYAEVRLSDAVTRGIHQCVILGAGLDSLAYRSPLVGGVRVFEVDHPDTQAWKRDQLAAAAIAVPPAVRFVAVDFGVDSLAARLADMGFDRTQPAFVTWIGVTQYLSGCRHRLHAGRHWRLRPWYRVNSRVSGPRGAARRRWAGLRRLVHTPSCRVA